MIASPARMAPLLSLSCRLLLLLPLIGVCLTRFARGECELLFYFFMIIISKFIFPKLEGNIPLYGALLEVLQAF